MRPDAEALRGGDQKNVTATVTDSSGATPTSSTIYDCTSGGGGGGPIP
jgi:hypothetical protein